jgi:hypothetical protein
MKANSQNDLHESGRLISKTIKRTIRSPKKAAPATEELRGWAKSTLKSRNKS